MTKKKWESINGLRGIIIWVVVIYHMGSNFPIRGGVLQPFYQYGGKIVNYFFFMTSGFTLTYAYRTRIIEKSIDFKHFILGRIGKWYPYFVITTIWQILFLHIRHVEINFDEVILNLLMVTSGWADDIYPFNYPCWFLCVLLLCYIIYFIITRNVKKEYHLYFYAGLVIWGYILENRGMDIPFCYNHDGEGFFNFFLGCILYEIYTNCAPKLKKMVCTAGLCAVAGIAAISAIVGFDNFAGDVRTVLTLFIYPIVILSIVELEPVKRIFANKAVLLIFARISILVFFWHVPWYELLNVIYNHVFDNLNREMRFCIYIITLFIWCHIVKLLENKIRKIMQKTDFRNRLSIFLAIDGKCSQ